MTVIDTPPARTAPRPLTTHSQLDLTHAARRLAYRPAAWRPAVRFDEDARTYTRIPLPDTDGYEAWLLTWLPGQGTGLHDHAGSAGAFAIVEGTLTEYTAEQDVEGRTAFDRVAWGAGDVRAFGTRHVHDVHNEHATPAVSIHVYAPSLAAMTRYELERGRLVTVRHDRAGIDW